MRIFLAGASGAIGRRLMPLLIGAGHDVTGLTRSAEAARDLKAAGVTPAVADVYEADGLTRAVIASRPDIVMHQLTDLPRVFDETQVAAQYPRNARIRIEGTRNLVAAAKAAGARRFIVQSVAFAYAPGKEPYAETDPLNVADGPRVVTVRAAADMEQQVLKSGMEAVVAALLSLTGKAGIYNIADDDGTVSIDKARKELGFDPAFRLKA
jgi:nucleoside-diphosphate-sugar epimerase